MAATPTIIKRISRGGVRTNYLDVALDSSYPTGGYALSFNQLGFAKAPLLVDAEQATGRTYWYDRANQKLVAFSTAATEVANATNLSAVTVRVAVDGIV